MTRTHREHGEYWLASVPEGFVVRPYQTTWEAERDSHYEIIAGARADNGACYADVYRCVANGHQFVMQTQDVAHSIEDAITQAIRMLNDEGR